MGPGVQALAGVSRPGDRLSSPGGGVGGCCSESSKDWRQDSQVPLTKCISAESGETEAETLDSNQGRQKERKTIKF